MPTTISKREKFDCARRSDFQQLTNQETESLIEIMMITCYAYVNSEDSVRFPKQGRRAAVMSVDMDPLIDGDLNLK
jgi:hypothetical protein